MHLLLQPSPRIRAGRLGDNRGDYFSESFSVSPRIRAGRLSVDNRGDNFPESFRLLENPYIPSLSESFTSSFGQGMDYSFVDQVLICSNELTSSCC